MKIEIEVSDERASALAAVAGTTDPLEYLQARVNEVLDRYATQTRAEEARVVAEAFKAAPEADRLAAFTALKINPATPS